MAVLFLDFLRNLHTMLHRGSINLYSYSGRGFHIFQQLFVDFFDGGHSDLCEVIPHYSFGLSFSNNKQC